MARDALADAGEDKLAWDLLLRTDFPSWGYMVRQGATTIWERWNGDTGDVAMNSFNHYALGAVCGFLYRRFAGIDPIEPGFAKFRVAPIFDPRIPQFGGKVDSVRGKIETRWTYKDGRASLELVVPSSTTAEIIMEGAKREVGGGHHKFIF